MDVDHIRNQDIKVSLGPRSEKVSFLVLKNPLIFKSFLNDFKKSIY